MNKVGFFRSIQWKFIIIYILLLLVAVQIIGSYFVREIEAELIDTFKGSINDRVELLSYNLEEVFMKDRAEDEEISLEQEVQNVVRDIDMDALTTLQVVNNQSRVIGTNDYLNQDILGKKTTEDIVQKALLFGSPLNNTMIDPETDTRIYVKADPIVDEENDVVGVIYLEAPLTNVYSQLQKINQIFLRGSILAITVAAILGVLVARAITKPIIEMRRQAQTMARGDFSQKVKIYGTDEISQLAETFNDLNDRLKMSIATTEKEQQKLSSVLSNMTEGVIATDQIGNITVMNEAANTLIGKKNNPAQSETLLEFLDLEDRVSDMKGLEERSSVIIDLSTDDIFLVRANFSKIVDERGRLTGYITVLSDVTDEERMEQERREFVSNVSHELRTPLTTMRSYLEALSDGAWQDEEIAPKFIAVTQDETERMIRLVNELLELSRMDSKEYTLERRRINFVEYFGEVIDRFEMNLDESYRITRDLPSKGTYDVWLDKDKMTQVIDNIISNAIKYSPEGGTISCSVRKVESKNRHLLISIKDEGIGIPFDKKDKIFERFYRADRARTRKLGGSGLGLAITKELVEAHSGEIWVNSQQGKGTSISFTLPLLSGERGDSL
ncbi:MAG TPA: cell wall metabolism sensor histidine kinase WalK [Bacillota bacterium]|nr:cell wall metabolism sensor histidine kinase WalK [Bacillota bacterium]